MKRITLMLILITCIAFLAADWIELNSIEKQNVIAISPPNYHQTEIQFTLDGFSLAKNGVYHKLDYESEGTLSEFGKPDLPHFSRLLAIPEGAQITVDYSILASETMDSLLLYPFQDEDRDIFLIDNDFYSQATTYPQAVVQISETAFLRDMQVVNVTINPFQYNPQKAELTIHHKIDVKLSFTEGSKHFHAVNRKKSRFFEPLYQAVITNYDELPLRSIEYQTPSYLFIYANNSLVESTLQTLLQWKRQKGFEVTAVSTAITGTTTTAIKNYIQDAYDNWENPPEFVCLVGDANGNLVIPTYFYNGGEGDHYYALLAGNDILADVFIGRLSIGSNNDLQTIISKIINYEKQPFTGNPNWFQNALLIGDPSSSGQTTISLNKYIKETILITNPEFDFIEGYSGNYVNTINNGLNQGASYFNYRGYIGMSGWSNSNTTNLNNGFMLPFVMLLTCSTGNFSATYEEARSEIFLRAGTPSNPKGGIAAIGTATSATHTTFNNMVNGATYYGIFIDGLYSAGAALTRGKTSLFYSYPNNPMNAVEKFSYWNNLMGDPGLALWTAKPRNLNVEFPEIISVGTNYIEVVVTDNAGNFLQNVWVTALRDDDLFVSGYTDDSGKVFLNMFTEQTGDVTLTATKQNFIPSIHTIFVEQPEQFVNIDDVLVIDDNTGSSSGNGNGVPNPGEQIELRPTIKNYGTDSTSSLTAFISSESEYLTIIDEQITFEALAAGETAFPNENFVIFIHENTPNLLEIVLEITISDDTRTMWHDMLILTIESPELHPVAYNVTDNNNGIADPGETIALTVTLQNIGELTVNNLFATISSDNPLLEIDVDNGFFGNLAPTSTSSNTSSPFTVTVKPLALPGSQIFITLDFYNNSGFQQTGGFFLDIGTVTVTDPLGPDAYGYWAYDDGDENYLNTPTYNWYEIDPNYGGQGTVLSMYDNGDNGDLADVDLPFIFPFYGVSYDMITICTNGFIVPGGTENYSYMNRSIPGPNAPAPLIAPFWDDLKMGSGRICYDYNTEQNLFIVQWSRLQNDYDNAEETFQAIFYDPSYYHTGNGDGMIAFQYKTINNTNQGEYGGWSVQHGQFATVGLQDHTATRGLQYTYNNTYPTAAKPLENEMAILFTGAPIPFEEAYLVLGEMNVYSENGNNQLDFGEQAELEIILNNIGGTDATGVSAIISTDDPYISILSDQAAYGTIPAESSGINDEAFVVLVAANAPDGHIAQLSVSVTGNEGSWDLLLSARLHSPNFVFSAFLANDGDNYMLDPGETSDVFVLIENKGGSPLSDVTAILSSQHNLITINDDTDSSFRLEGNMSESFRFNVTASASATVGASIPFEIELISSNYQTVVPFNINIGLAFEGFESGTFDSFPWEFGGSGQWQISNQPYEGIYSARSAVINDNEFSSLIIQVDMATSGQISFYKRVSSENNYDYFYFKINGQTYGQWSGEVPWSQETYTIPAGSNTLEWRYDKDFMISAGQDCAWLDNIEFPGNAQQGEPILEISESAINLVLEQGQLRTETFTISNVGGLVSLYSIFSDPDYHSLEWLDVNPASGYVMGSETDVIYLDFDVSELDVGLYGTELIIDFEQSEYIIPIFLEVVGTDTDNDVTPAATKLFANYPNPFNPETTISFTLDSAQDVSLSIYNLKGQKIKTLVKDTKSSGLHQIVWDGKNSQNKQVGSGVYFYQLETEKGTFTKKMLMIK